MDPDGRPQRALRQLGLFALALFGVVVIGLVGGFLYARSSPERAARSLVEDHVVVEPDRGEQPPPAGDVAPTSGAHDGVARCGVSAVAVGVDDQLAALASGAVVIQYQPRAGVPSDDLLELGQRADVLVAPNPRLEDPVVAAAWRRRLVLPVVNRELLAAFVTAYRGQGPVDGPCPPLAAQ